MDSHGQVTESKGMLTPVHNTWGILICPDTIFKTFDYSINIK